MTWYAEACAWIQQQKLLHPGMTHQEIRRHCSRNYPFHVRRGYAYKAFLRAMKDHFGAARRSKPTNQGELLQ